MWVAKVCEPLGLSVNLKVKLESGVFNQWDDNQVWVSVLFYLKNRDLSEPDLHNTFVEVYHGINKGDFKEPQKELFLTCNSARGHKETQSSSAVC